MTRKSLIPGDRDWLAAALSLIERNLPCVLVTLASTRGSTPRAAGTRMLVHETGIVGSVGGGQLEQAAVNLARQALRLGDKHSRTEHFILGPDLGQCCGGALDLVIEPLSSPALGWLRTLVDLAPGDQNWKRIVKIGEESSVRIVGAGGEASGFGEMLAGLAPGAATIVKSGADLYLVEASPPPPQSLYLFGAGHVGKALVRLLGGLAYRVTWVDSRDESFPTAVPGNVRCRLHPQPEEIVAEAPAGAMFLVMTHSHALDFDIVAGVLGRGDFSFLGLIGSATKRQRFVLRLRADGFGDAALARLVCPIGIAGISGKAPETIAIAVAAQLLQENAALAARQCDGEGIPAAG